MVSDNARRAILTAALLLVAWSGAFTARPAMAAGPGFGFSSFSINVVDRSNNAFTQAGGHPFALTTDLSFNTEVGAFGVPVAVGDPKDVRVELPPGLIGNANLIPKCEFALFNRRPEMACPIDSQVGTVVLRFASVFFESTLEGAVYNLTPESNEPAEFGFATPTGANFVLAVNVRTGEGYGVRVDNENIPLANLTGAQVTFWGVPAEAAHDAQRGRLCESFLGQEFCREGHEGGKPSGAPEVPLLTMPTACSAGPSTATILADSWESPLPSFPVGAATATSTLPGVTGCDLLTFTPNLTVQSESAQRDKPSGMHVRVGLPQRESVNTLATPEVRRASVTMPAGVVLSPAAGDGLTACSDAAFDERSTQPASCPSSSQVGTVRVETALLPVSLEGQLFVGEPMCGVASSPSPCGPADAQEGRMFRVFLQAIGDGVTVKLKGRTMVNQISGQVTTVFDETPQLPFTAIGLTIKGGARAPLAMPQMCGDLAATSDFEPWSAPGTTPEGVETAGTEDAFPVSPPFRVTGCSGNARFSPGFSAGVVQTLGGHFTPFTMTLSRNDGEQDVGGLSMTMPPGVSANLSGIPLCDEADANAGTCSEASKVGVVNAAAGSGSAPLWLSGPVYLTGPYKGQPFGLSIVVPAHAGPFNLGDVVTRASIHVDPWTGRVTVTSDPLQQARDGVPFRLKEINVAVDRPEFILNPTRCTRLEEAGTVAGVMPDGAAGSSASVSSPFAVAGCKNLPFKPKFSVYMRAKHSRANGASLHVVVRSSLGQANIGAVHVELPKALPSRLSTLKLACPEGTFDADPARCPAGSRIGGATARTPLLPVRLSGPVYFVSHGGAKFPELVAVLQGDGVTIDLAGETFISSKSITSSTFSSVPDLPVTRFDLNLPAGPHSALAANVDLCKSKLTIPTTIKGQNGAMVKQKTKVAVEGCRKTRK